MPSPIYHCLLPIYNISFVDPSPHNFTLWPADYRLLRVYYRRIHCLVREICCLQIKIRLTMGNRVGYDGVSKWNDPSKQRTTKCSCCSCSCLHVNDSCGKNIDLLILECPPNPRKLFSHFHRNKNEGRDKYNS